MDYNLFSRTKKFQSNKNKAHNKRKHLLQRHTSDQHILAPLVLEEAEPGGRA
jgi:hypothetical protein